MGYAKPRCVRKAQNFRLRKMMSYIEKSLGAGEKVIAMARLHWWFMVNAWAVLIVSVVIPVYVWTNFASKIGRYASLVVLAYGVVRFATAWLQKNALEIGVTSHRVVRKSGILSLHTDEIALHNVEGVRISQSLWGRMLGYGTLRVEGTGVDAVEIPAISDPVAFRAAIETAKGTAA
jgi:hypothetical protein